MTIFVAFVRSLLADPRSVRAFDEATLDWRTEAAETTSAFGRVLINLRGFLSIARVFVMVLPREVTAPSTGLMVRIGLLVLLPAIVTSLRPMASYAGQPEIRQLGPAFVSLLLLMLMPQAIAASLPVAVFWAGLWPPRRRPQPWAALAVCTAFVSLALLGWIVPYANQAFRVQVFAAMTHVSVAQARLQLGQGLPETTLIGLFVFHRALAVTLVGVSVLAGALVVLASRLGGGWRRRWIFAGVVPIAYFASYSSPLAPWILSAAALWYSARRPA